jgi:hypothetical protein
VHDPGTKAGGGSSLSGTGADRNRPLVVPAGFPPTVLYELTTRGATDDVLVAPGPTPVFARRFVRRDANAATGHGEPMASQSRQAARLQWLAQMVRCEVADFGAFTRSQTCVWRDEATLRADAARWRQELDDSFRAVEQRCRRADLDDRLDAARRPLRLTIRVQDSRRDQTTPLPTLD